jgi:hypothetical protein
MGNAGRTLQELMAHATANLDQNRKQDGLTQRHKRNGRAVTLKKIVSVFRVFSLRLCDFATLVFALKWSHFQARRVKPAINKGTNIKSLNAKARRRRGARGKNLT